MATPGSSFPLLRKEGPGEVEAFGCRKKLRSSSRSSRRKLLPLLPSPYKGEAQLRMAALDSAAADGVPTFHARPVPDFHRHFVRHLTVLGGRMSHY